MAQIATAVQVMQHVTNSHLATSVDREIGEYALLLLLLGGDIEVTFVI